MTHESSQEEVSLACLYPGPGSGLQRRRTVGARSPGVNRYAFVGSFLTISLLACGIGSSPVASAELPEYASSLRRKVVIDGEGEQRYSIEERMRHYGVPGASVAVVDGCRIVDARGFGVATPGNNPVTPETVFQAGSVSKVVASAGALKLVEDGVLSLDQDVSSHLRGWVLPRTGPFEHATVTLRQLLTHGAGLSVAGFKGYPTGTPLPSLTQILDGEAPANTLPVRIENPPGVQWRYSGGGFVLVQLLMEQGGGSTFSALMRDRVLRPAHMEHSSYQPPSSEPRRSRAAHGTLADGTPIPGGWLVYPEQAAAGLWTSPTDLSRFAIELVHSMRGEEGALLRQATANEMMRRQLGAWGLGLELAAEGEPRKFSHTGAPVGYRTLWLMFPDTCQGATIMTNADEGMGLAFEVARALADTYGWPDRMPSEQAAQVHLTTDIAARFIGTYQLRDFPAEHFDVECMPDDTLVWSRKGHGHRDLVAIGEDELLSPDSGMRLVALERDPESDAVTTLELRFPGGVNIARRTNIASSEDQ